MSQEDSTDDTSTSRTPRISPVGGPGQWRLSRWAGELPKIAALEPELQQLGDQQLRKRSLSLRYRAKSGESLNRLLVEGYALVREAAVEWARHNIRINAVAPCQFLTPGLEKVLNDPVNGGREALQERMLAKIPVGRFGLPEEIVGPCIFLASQAASMVTGQTLFVDGGYTAQ